MRTPRTLLTMLTVWHQIETTFTAHAPYLILAVHTLSGGNASGTAWIDDVDVRRTR